MCQRKSLSRFLFRADERSGEGWLCYHMTLRAKSSVRLWRWRVRGWSNKHHIKDIWQPRLSTLFKNMIHCLRFIMFNRTFITTNAKVLFFPYAHKKSDFEIYCCICCSFNAALYISHSLLRSQRNNHCPHSLTGWGNNVASVSPEDCVEVKQLSVAEGHEAGADSGEVRLTGSYYAVHCPQTEVPASGVTLQFLICLTDLFVSRNL